MKYLCVINPISGDIRKKRLEKTLKEKYKENIDFIFWATKEFDIAKEVEKKISIINYNKIIICGGDGTINRVARALINKDIPLAIIPVGSGNGLARALNIPININKSLKLIDSGNLRKIDVGLINNSEIFLCTFGLGFDAYIAHEFAKSKKRGVFTYFKKVVKNVFTHKAQNFKIYIDNKEYNIKSFFINIANINQWGFNIKVAPKACVNDGLFDITIVKEFKYIELPYLVFMLLIGKLHLTHRSLYFKTNHVKIISPSKLCHYDGEAVEINDIVEIKVIPSGLTFITP
ncbi:MAG: diacylglycerol kinase family lipid kinase [Bacteroidales bacterium]|nr:diacylglycerol kinase family lipid kinase [Bacteroidales bacterium]